MSESIKTAGLNFAHPHKSIDLPVYLPAKLRPIAVSKSDGLVCSWISFHLLHNTVVATATLDARDAERELAISQDQFVQRAAHLIVHRNVKFYRLLICLKIHVERVLFAMCERNRLIACEKWSSDIAALVFDVSDWVSRYRNGQWLILVDQNDAYGRRRFTLGHEFKHVIDDPIEEVLYAKLGYGDPQVRQRQIEALCQHFAACLLMPRDWVTAAWLNGIRDIYNLASLFQVSVSAMEIRLKNLGMWNAEPERNVRTFFRPIAAPPLDNTRAKLDSKR